MMRNMVLGAMVVLSLAGGALAQKPDYTAAEAPRGAVWLDSLDVSLGQKRGWDRNGDRYSFGFNSKFDGNQQPPDQRRHVRLFVRK